MTIFDTLKNRTLPSKASSRKSSVASTPFDSVYSEESFSSFSDDSDGDRRRRGRRQAVASRKRKVKTVSVAPKKEKVVSSRTAIKKEAAVKPKAKKAAVKASPEPSPGEVVKIAKKEGTTKFQQMRKFLAKANEAEKPQDMLATFLASRRAASPTRSSVGSVGSPRGDGFHTGLTPTSSRHRLPSPTVVSRDSEDGFAAFDLLAGEGDAVEHKLGSFLHGQRSLNLRLKSKAVGAGDNLHLTALLMDDIPDMEKKMEQVSRAELRTRILANTAEEDAEKENLSSLDDSQLADFDIVAGL